MKLSSSTSLIFATLAVSSSSTSLAAPAGDSFQTNGELSSSSSTHQLARERRASVSIPRAEIEQDANQVVEQAAQSSLCAVLIPVQGLVGGIVGAIPMIGGPVNGLLNTVVGPLIPCDPATAAATQGVNTWSTEGSPSPAVSPAAPPNTPAMSDTPTSSSSLPSRRDLPVHPPEAPVQAPARPSSLPVEPPLNSPAQPLPNLPTQPPVNPPADPSSQAPVKLLVGAAGIKSPAQAPVKSAKPQFQPPVGSMHTPSNLTAPEEPAPPVRPPVSAPTQKNRRRAPRDPTGNVKHAAEKIEGKIPPFVSPTNSSSNAPVQGNQPVNFSPASPKAASGPNRRSRRQVPVKTPEQVAGKAPKAHVPVQAPVQAPIGSSPTSSVASTTTTAVTDGVAADATPTTAGMTEAAAPATTSGSTDDDMSPGDDFGDDEDNEDDGDDEEAASHPA
ncbi:hypothetical protein Moror_4014 [Moniliophthora roreri MCA 2997]|uniref:Uncharacterized protein n=2 Tax=Moniliophthora roreri TaxID=221103 RepID=V2XQX8_MONRO|nr:hypothetical protein Moror_4014 [Moniliophthora roreri MCA 2997]KAI3616110.1 hypothetical protein WG66_013918 [Moniliophthora roreri]